MNFITDAQGQILQRNETDDISTGEPHERHFYLSGMQVGDVGNNGTSNVDYATSIARHRAIEATGSNWGAFDYGMVGTMPAVLKSNVATGTKYADFDQSYDPINGLSYDSTSSHYTVVEGETLQSIAYTVWGDTSLWYMIADANGLNGSETLVAGQDLVIPNKVHNSHNSSDIYRVYDPNEAIGNTSPTMPKKPKHPDQKCGVMGQILLVVIAVVVAYFTAGAALAAMGVTVPAGTAATTGALMAAADLPTAVAAGAIGGAAGSIVSQGVGLALGIQNKFDWGAVGMAAIQGGVGAGLGKLIPGTGFFESVARGALGSVVTQGIAVATGLQKKFDWAGVAAAGVMAGVTSAVSSALPGAATSTAPATFGNQLISGMAGVIAGAGVRTLANGSDFGDNIMAMLPDAIGQTIGNAVAGAVEDRQNMAMFEKSDAKIKYNPSAERQEIIATGVTVTNIDPATFTNELTDANARRNIVYN